MIEIYVLMTLFGVGYYMNQNRRPPSSNPTRQINVNEMPSQKTQHESNFTDTVKKIEALKAAKMFDGSVPNVISSVKTPQTIRSNLADVNMSPSEFVHNNMVPFFRGASTKQNIDPSSNKSLLEQYTGVSNSLHPKKHEREPLFGVHKDISYVNGAPDKTAEMRKFISEPIVRNNTLPFNQVRVGPGINAGFTSTPKGGFQQFDVQDAVRPKTVDELRVKTNPKETYNGRIIDGQKGSMRGKIGAVNKNHVDTYYENSSDRYLKTTGAYLKPTQHGAVNLKDTSRQSTSVSYTGGAFSAKNQTIRSDVRPSSKQELGPSQLGAASLVNKGKGSQFDYGKKNILVYSNERDVTSTKTYQGNITSVVKAIVSPLQDIFRATKKEYMVDAPREFGSVQAQIPSKAPVYDPNDTARTTIKETLIQEAEKLNFKGASKITVYCKDDVARTTIKESTLQEAAKINLKGGAFKGTVHDPKDVPRTTGKETLLSEAERLNIKGGALKGTVHDPKDVPRTTNKETLLQDSEALNVRGGAFKGTVYDPYDVPQTTNKETLLQDSEALNVRGGAFKGTVYDPYDVPQTTNKETLLQDIAR